MISGTDPSAAYEDYALVGTKGYCFENLDSREHAAKLVERELVRLRICSFSKSNLCGIDTIVDHMHFLSGRKKDTLVIAVMLAAWMTFSAGCGASVGLGEANAEGTRVNAGFTGQGAGSDNASTADTAPDSQGKAPEDTFLVVLDPGHTAELPDGSEPIGPGAAEMKEKDTLGTTGVSTGLHEYELNLQVCQKLRKELEQREYQVILTHDTNDTRISCSERAQVANKNHADVFLRIHADGLDDPSARGATALCITKNNPYHPQEYEASYQLSKDVLLNYCLETGVQNRGVMLTDGMSGNNWSEVPCTLLEMGFMTNAAEDEWMASEEGQDRIVQAIADGLDVYRKNHSSS